MDIKTNIKEIEIRELFTILLRRLWIMVLAAIVAVGGLFIVNNYFTQPTYASTATMYLLRQTGEGASANETAYNFSIGLNVVEDCTHLLKSHTVLDAAREALSLEQSYTQLKDSLSTNNPPDTRILEVTIESSSPELAKQTVDRVCEIGAEAINGALGFEQVRLYEKGTLPTRPNNRFGLKMYALVGVAAAVLVYGVFLLLHLLDDTLQSAEEIERHLGLAVLGDIPDAELFRKKRYGYEYAAERQKK